MNYDYMIDEPELDDEPKPCGCTEPCECAGPSKPSQKPRGEELPFCPLCREPDGEHTPDCPANAEDVPY